MPGFGGDHHSLHANPRDMHATDLGATIKGQAIPDDDATGPLFFRSE